MNIMGQKKLTILLIIPNLSQGGAQNVFRQHYEYLSKKYILHGCVFNWEGTSNDLWPSSITSLNVTAGRNLFEKTICFAKRVARLRRLKKKLNVDVSISHLEGADYVNILSRRLDKVILWIHGTKQFDANITGLMGWFRKSVFMPWLYQKADEIVTVSNGIALEMSKHYPRTRSKLHTIYNGFDLARIHDLAQKEIDINYTSLCNRYTVIITHCRLAAQKNISGFIHIACALKNNDQLKWVIIGDGELREELVELCALLSLPSYTIWSKEPWSDRKQVYFLGFQANPFSFLKKAHLFVMTSSWEGFPLALCEAMACSLPVMAADCYTGPREILALDSEISKAIETPERQRYGILMPLLSNADENNVIGWSVEIEKVLKEPDVLKAYSLLGVERVREFSSDTSLQQVNQIINSTCDI